MKSYLSKLGVLLFGVMFAVAGCQDYDEDIRKVNDRLDENTKELTTITEELDAAIAALEAKHDADLSKVKADLQGEIASKVADAKKALEEAYKAADADLQSKIDAAIKKAEDAAKALEEAYKKADEEIKKAYAAADAALESKLTGYVDGKVKTLNESIASLSSKHDQDMKAAAAELLKVKQDLEAADTAIKGQIADLDKAVKANATEIANLKTALEQAKTDLEKAIADGDKAEAEARDKAIAAAVEALTKTHNQDIADVKALIEANKKAIEKEVAARDSVATVLRGEFAKADADLKAELQKLIDDNAKAITDLKDLYDNLADDLETLKKDLAAFQQKAEELYALKTDLSTEKVRINQLYTDLANIKEDVYKQLEDHMQKINDLNTKLGVLTENVATIASRIQSLVYVPDYSDGKATLHFAVVPPTRSQGTTGIQDICFVPRTDILRYKVNSTVETAAADLAKAWNEDNSILSFDLEGVQVRGASAKDAKLEIKAVEVDEDGYLAVTVLAKNFDPTFYLSTIACMEAQNRVFANMPSQDRAMMEAVFSFAKQMPNSQSYSASLVLTQEDKENNVASEFTNMLASDEIDILDLAVKFTAYEDEQIWGATSVDLEGMVPYAQEHMIPSHRTDTTVLTSPSQALIELDGELYTEEDLYEKFGYEVNVKKQRQVVSYCKDGKDSNGDYKFKQDAAKPIADLDWTVDAVLYNNEKFIVDAPDAIGTSRKVSLTEYDEENKAKYDERVYDYIEVVDAYFLGPQSVAIADKVEITKNLVYVNFDAVEYNWTLQKAFDLRATDGTPYANTIVLKDVNYSNIYNIEPILNGSNAKILSTTLNGQKVNTPIKIRNIDAPEAGKAGKAEIWLEKGYEFAAADADKPNTYVKKWQAVLSETTDAIITVTVTLGKYPETVEVVSECDLKLVPGESWFDGKDALIADAYAELGAERAGFPEDAKVNDLMFSALTDEANDPKSHTNFKFNVVDNVDNSFIRLYKSQIEDPAALPKTMEFTYEMATWFNVPFKFVVTGNVIRPDVNLVRSTDYAKATEQPKVYKVKLNATVVGSNPGVYTVNKSDLGYYLNLTGEDVNETQKVEFEIIKGKGNIADKNGVDNVETSVDPLATPVNNPLVGEVTAYLEKDQTILTWDEPSTEIVVKATLWVGDHNYPIDEATLILEVEDPLSLEVKDRTVKRLPQDDTEVVVFDEWKLFTSAMKEDGFTPYYTENMIVPTAAAVADAIDSNYNAFGAEVKVDLLTIYEKVDDTEAGKVRFDESKYSWNSTTGRLVLLQDDAAELLHPVVAHIRVTFTHNVHATAEKCSETYDMFVTFVN